MSEPAGTRMRAGRDPRAKCAEADANGCLDQRVPVTRPEKRWKEMTIEPALIRADRDRDAYDTDRCDWQAQRRNA